MALAKTGDMNTMLESAEKYAELNPGGDWRWTEEHAKEHLAGIYGDIPARFLHHYNTEWIDAFDGGNNRKWFWLVCLIEGHLIGKGYEVDTPYGSAIKLAWPPAADETGRKTD